MATDLLPNGDQTLPNIDTEHELWEDAVKVLEGYLRTAIQPSAHFEYSEIGMRYIPLKRSTWLAISGGMEPPKGIILAKPPMRWLYSEGHTQKDIKTIGKSAKSVWVLVWAVVRNTLITSKALRVPISRDAVARAVGYYLDNWTSCKWPYCNETLVCMVQEKITEVCHHLIDTYCNETLEQLSVLKGCMQVKQMRVYDMKRRRDFKKQLEEQGLLEAETKEKQAKIIGFVSSLPAFKEGLNNLERSAWAWLYKQKKVKPSTKKEDRLQLIKDKIARGETLTDAEKMWKSRHKQLFITQK